MCSRHTEGWLITLKRSFFHKAIGRNSVCMVCLKFLLLEGLNTAFSLFEMKVWSPRRAKGTNRRWLQVGLKRCWFLCTLLHWLLFRSAFWSGPSCCNVAPPSAQLARTYGQPCLYMSSASCVLPFVIYDIRFHSSMAYRGELLSEPSTCIAKLVSEWQIHVRSSFTVAV